jgi:hypothetical protein
MKQKVLNYDFVDDDLIDEIYDRISNDNNYKSIKEKRKAIEYMYNSDTDLIPYALTHDELSFLKSSLGKEIDPTFFSINLSKLGLYVKNDYGFYVIPENIYHAVLEALDNYKTNQKEIDDTKLIIYLLLGLVRTEGALRVDKLFDIINLYVPITQDIIDVVYMHPLFKRFLTLDTYKDKHTYIIFREFIGIDYDYVKYKSANELNVYDKVELINRGRFYFDIDNKYYKSCLSYPRLAYLLSKIDREELLLFAGSNNYDFEEYLKDYDLSDLTDEEYSKFDTFVRSLPSFIPTDKDNLFISALDSKDLDNIVSLLFNHAKKTMISHVSDDYDKEFGNVQSYVLTHLSDLVEDVISTYDISDKEEEFLLSLTKYNESEYLIYKLNKDGLYLIETSSGKIFRVKIELSSYYRDHKLTKHFARILLANYNGYIVMITYNQLDVLKKEDVDKYKEIYNKNKHNVIFKIEEKN